MTTQAVESDKTNVHMCLLSGAVRTFGLGGMTARFDRPVLWTDTCILHDSPQDHPSLVVNAIANLREIGGNKYTGWKHDWRAFNSDAIAAAWPALNAVRLRYLHQLASGPASSPEALLDLLSESII